MFVRQHCIHTNAVVSGHVCTMHPRHHTWCSHEPTRTTNAPPVTSSVQAPSARHKLQPTSGTVTNVQDAAARQAYEDVATTLTLSPQPKDGHHIHQHIRQTYFILIAPPLIQPRVPLFYVALIVLCNVYVLLTKVFHEGILVYHKNNRQHRSNRLSQPVSRVHLLCSWCN